MKIQEELAGAVRSEAARGRPGRGPGGPWASGRPRRGAPRLPHALPVSGRPDRRRRRRAQLFPPRRGAQGGGGERKASPPGPGSQAAAVLERGRGAEPPPRSARRTSPFLPLSRLYATTSRPPLAAATGRHPRSARRPVIPHAPRSGKASRSRGHGPGRRPRADARPVSAAPTPAPLQQLRSPALTP